MKLTQIVQSLLLSITLVGAAAATAQVSFNIHVGPPPPLYETVPMLQDGYVWAPGYWAWNHDRHIWVRGRTMLQRTGYRWEPDRWEQRGDAYYRQPGNWQRDGQLQSPRVQQIQRVHQDQRVQKPQKPRHQAHQGGPWPEDQGNSRR
jgi:hypothetical protein